MSNSDGQRRKKKPLYGPEDGEGLEYQARIGDPGEPPFVRGIYPEMYRQKLWTMRQYAGFGTAEESNRRFRHLLSEGTTGLSVAFDLPTQVGLDSDEPRARGEVGRVGVAIDSVEDMERLFEGIPLEKVSTSMTINATAPILLAFYLVVARRRGVAWAELHGTVQNDILKEYMARGTHIYPPGPSLGLATDLMAFCAAEAPSWNTISVSGYHIREAGATAAQELAFTLANAETYLLAAREAGLDAAKMARRFSFFFNAHSDFLEEVAKFRAARYLWSALLEERFSISDKEARRLRFHAQTAGSTLTAQQPENNVVRVAFQALAAVLGGAQSLHTNGKDEALALPSEEAATLALRTQQILAHETGLTQTVDPLGGAWCVEALTRQLVDSARRSMQDIRDRGGVLRALEEGYIQSEIQNAAYEHQRAVEKSETIVVGVNRFVEEGNRDLRLERHDPELEERQVTRLEQFRRRREEEAVRKQLQMLRGAARSGDALMPCFIEAAETGATVGEMAGVLREVYGEHQETGTI